MAVSNGVKIDWSVGMLSSSPTPSTSIKQIGNTLYEAVKTICGIAKSLIKSKNNIS